MPKRPALARRIRGKSQKGVQVRHEHGSGYDASDQLYFSLGFLYGGDNLFEHERTQCRFAWWAGRRLSPRLARI